MQLTKTPLAPLKFVLPSTVFVVAVLAGSSPVTAACLAVPGLVLARMVSSGIELHPTRRAYRTYYSLLGYAVGRWKPLAAIVGLTIKPFSYANNPSPSDTSWGMWNDSRPPTREIVTLLSVAGSQTGVVLKTFPAQEARKAAVFAQNLASQLDVPLNSYL